MPNRLADQFQQTLVRGLWSVFVEVQFNGSGTPTLIQQVTPQSGAKWTFAAAPAAGTRWGALTFVRNGTGDYTLTFVDKYVRVLAYSCTWIASTNTAAPITQMKVASNPNAAASTTGMGWTGANGSPSQNAVELLFFSAQGSAADPAATEMAVFAFQMQGSAAN